MELRVIPIPEEEQKDDKRYAVVDWDTEPAIPWDCFATTEEAERFIESFNFDREALEGIKPKVEEFINGLAQEIGVHPFYVADHVGRFALDIVWPPLPPQT